MIFYLKLFCYAWALIELISLTNLYAYAKNNMKKSRVIVSLFWFLASVTFEFVYRFIMNYTVVLTTDPHRALRNGLILPIILIAIAARGFKKSSLERRKAEELAGNYTQDDV